MLIRVGLLLLREVLLLNLVSFRLDFIQYLSKALLAEGYLTLGASDHELLLFGNVKCSFELLFKLGDNLLEVNEDVCVSGSTLE